MEIRVDGYRSSIGNWTRAQSAPPDEVPALTDAQKTAAEKLGVDNESYARNLYAGDLERKELAKRAEQAAQIVERFASQRISGVHVDFVWLKTFDRKFRFDVDLNGSGTQIFVSEDLIDELLENGSKVAEEQIMRIIDASLPASWTVRAS